MERAVLRTGREPRAVIPQKLRGEGKSFKERGVVHRSKYSKVVKKDEYYKVIHFSNYALTDNVKNSSVQHSSKCGHGMDL